ncbi:prepilin-type N-terminal cleavage/methylation domain-containing protein [Alkalibacterium putridalgicola]|uniref:type IV pilus modification PilV family protein n=1 Tax=Alkalibacterium putridalgicola TaxID=426703 RepID=UPI0034CFC43A
MKNSLLKIRHDEEGTTLVELLAAIAILSIIVTSFLAFFIQSANTNKMTNEVNEATFVAQGVMEEITHFSSEGYTVAATEAELDLTQAGFTIEPSFIESTNSSLHQVIVIVYEGGNKRAQMETRLSFATSTETEAQSTP